MTPMQSIEHLSPDERRALIDSIQAENDELRQRAANAEAESERLRAENSELREENAALRGENAQQKLELESIGAGGVSRQRITDDGALEALQACEQAYHRMIVDGTPQDCRAHDAARVAFWRVFGGQS